VSPGAQTGVPGRVIIDVEQERPRARQGDRDGNTERPQTSVVTTLEPERDVTVAGQHFKARCAGNGPSVVMLPGDPELAGLWADIDGFNKPGTNKESLDRALRS
jgi:hypothetical protein